MKEETAPFKLDINVGIIITYLPQLQKIICIFHNKSLYLYFSCLFFYQRSLFTKASTTYQQEDIQTAIAINLT